MTRTMIALLLATAPLAFAAIMPGCAAPPEQAEPESVGEAESAIALPPCGGAGEACCPPYDTCGAGLQCNPNGICRVPCGGIDQKCCSGSGCTTGLVCSITGLCTKSGGGSTSSSSSGGGGCGSDFDCLPGDVCTNGRCTAPPSMCTTDLDCEGAQICRFGSCCTLDLSVGSSCPLAPVLD